MLKLITIILIIVSCGPKKEPQPDATKPSCEQRIKDKAAFYLAHTDLDKDGWIKDGSCDALLFNSLYNIGGGHSDITLARGAPGIWFRNASHDCYPQRAKSTISRDMFMGLLVWIWKEKRLDLVNEIIEYGENHENALGSWVMGEGDVFATGIRLPLQATVYELRYRLGGSDHGKRQIPQPRFDLRGYEDHLQILDIFLRAMLVGGISKIDFNAVKSSAEREPNNALFQAILHRYKDGNQSDAIKILLDEKLFPSDRMPSSSDRCEMYLWQRDTKNDDGSLNKDWLPCSGESKMFSAVDFLFAKAIILNEIQ